MNITIDTLTDSLKKQYKQQNIPLEDAVLFVSEGLNVGEFYCDYVHLGLGLKYEFLIDTKNMISHTGYLEIVPQRKGWGTKFINAREAFCREIGMKIIQLSIYDENVKSFFEKLGYTEGKKTLD